MFQDVLADAKKKHVVFPATYEDILWLLKKNLNYMDDVTETSVLHFDLWDGNLIVKDGMLKGIIDLERSFAGEPIADFVPLHFDIFDKDYCYLIDQYNQYAMHKIELDELTRRKYLIYKIYLRLIMVAECRFRQVEGSFDEQFKWAMGELVESLKDLHKMG